MKENKYDNERFFEQYSSMDRSVHGLKSAGEWHALKKMLPSLNDKHILDLGCGFGWHCRYAIDQGASTVTGIDISVKMLEVAQKKNSSPFIKYECMAVEDYVYPEDTFDVVLSSLTFHYIREFNEVCHKVYGTLKKGGIFVFSVEHPVFTAYGSQDWFYGESGDRLHWPVDNYFKEGKRNAIFLGEEMIKYHRTITTYMQDLISAGFNLSEIVEPQPEPSLLESIPGMKDELRRPMMMLISCYK